MLQGVPKGLVLRLLGASEKSWLHADLFLEFEFGFIRVFGVWGSGHNKGSGYPLANSFKQERAFGL